MEKNESGSAGRGILFNRSFSTLGCSFYFFGGMLGLLFLMSRD